MGTCEWTPSGPIGMAVLRGVRSLEYMAMFDSPSRDGAIWFSSISCSHLIV